MPLERYVTTYPASLGRHPDVLRVPVNKTSISFEKAPDFAAGEAVQEWERRVVAYVGRSDEHTLDLARELDWLQRRGHDPERR